MDIKAYAKVNLFLDIVGIRDDGYHLLKMIMQQIDLYDYITIDKADYGISIETNSDRIPKDNKNLAYKAAKMFLEKFNIKHGVNIYIEKNIPVEAGLAGGSTDAAAVLKGMRDLFKPKITNKCLEEIAVKLGADVPYCLYGGCVLCEGIGEIMTPLSKFENNILVLVKPSFGVSTKDVYKDIDNKKIHDHPSIDIIKKSIKDNDIYLLSQNMKNILEVVTLEKYPVLVSIKEEMNQFNAIGTLMSGSGPTIFGMFDNMLDAQRCYEHMKLKYEEVFITRTK